MTQHVVLDASAALEVVLRRPRAAVLIGFLDAAESVSAPDLFVAEVTNALWKHVRAGDLTHDEAREALKDTLQLPESFAPSWELASEALDLATKHGHPAYDAIYAALARRTTATVCTLDRRLGAMLDAMGVAKWSG